MTERHKIIQLTAENIKRIKAISIPIKDGLTVIAGDNAQGKSSALDCLFFLLQGKKHIDKKLLREGEVKGFVEAETDKLILKRTLTAAGGGNLTIKSKEGRESFSGPQGYLDEITGGGVCFDPLAFMRQNPKDQALQLRELVGLDFTETDSEIKATYDQRTEINRDYKRLAAEVEGMEYDAEATEKKDPAEVRKKLDEIDEQQLEVAEATRELENSKHAAQQAEASISYFENKIRDLEAELARAKSDLNEAKDEHDQQVQVVARHKVAIAAMESQIPDRTALYDELQTIQNHNANVEQTLRRKDKAEERDQARRVSDKLTRKIEDLERKKAEALKSAKFPVDGLSFTGEGVTFNGIPLSQASGAEQIRVAVAISAAMNPALPIMAIKDGSLLDKKSMKLIVDLAAELDLQILMERIERDEHVSIVIEDGEVAESTDADHTPTDQGTLTLES